MERTLTLSEEETRVVAELLDSAIADFSPEIAGTDNAAFRSMLKHRRAVLEGVRVRLEIDRDSR